MNADIAMSELRSRSRISRTSSFRSRVSYQPVNREPQPELQRIIPEEAEEEENVRGAWNSKADYLFTCIGYAVGKS